MHLIKTKMRGETPLLAYLEEDENLLWSGQPIEQLCDPFASTEIAFGIGFLLVGLLGFPKLIQHVPKSPADLAWMLAALAFVLLPAAFLLLGRRWMTARLRRKTWYGVTNRRLLWITGTFVRRAFSMKLEPSLKVTLIEGRDGTGTLRFGDAPDRDCKVILFGLFPVGEKIGLPSFECIRDVEVVNDMIASETTRLH
jgi:hypothetical protein